MSIHMQTVCMLLCCMYLLGSMVILSLLRQYLIYVDLTGIENISQPTLSCHVCKQYQKVILIRCLSQCCRHYFLFFSFLFQEIICQKNNVSMMYGFQLNYKHSRRLFHLMLFIFCFPLESFSTLLLYFTELEAEFWKFQQQILSRSLGCQVPGSLLPLCSLSAR